MKKQKKVAKDALNAIGYDSNFPEGMQRITGTTILQQLCQLVPLKTHRN